MTKLRDTFRLDGINLPAAVTLERNGACATLWLNRPEVKNALNAESIQLLRGFLAELAEDEGCQLLALRGRGGSFCAGWDVSDFTAFGSGTVPELEERLFRNHEVLTELRSAPQVTVALIDGPALGFGLGLVAVCDVAWAAEAASFGLPEIRYGIVPGSVMTEVQRCVPGRAALDWLLTGRTFDAAEALAAGLVSRVIPSQDFSVQIEKGLARLAATNRRSLLSIKRTHQAVAGLSDADAVKLAIEQAALSAHDPAVAEAARNFLKTV